ncbi:type II toxin-antitoxin system death-on-curing family toxin [Lysobacter sp. TAF61]|uniref:type II toxin-antitoxin system death-on-curing family toxin n=1 Tax=Lysobacter sp. TAF61 TaxID=3233072 RepID=UPI003F98963F
MREWRWLALDVILAVHDYQLAEHGGPDGVRDLGAIESALARPAQLLNYATPDAADLAACYCFGLAKNHGFEDGNKRTAWIALRVFLADNGFAFTFDPHEAVEVVKAVSASVIDEVALAGWIRAQVEDIDEPS